SSLNYLVWIKVSQCRKQEKIGLISSKNRRGIYAAPVLFYTGFSISSVQFSNSLSSDSFDLLLNSSKTPLNSNWCLLFAFAEYMFDSMTLVI
ncbi:MAG: hypothetical protein ABI855_02020, partial [Bacteroidota bacterium]